MAACLQWGISLLIFCSYFLYFTYADLEESLSNYDSLLSPSRLAYGVCIPLYAAMFGFASYQLLHKPARESFLVQRKLVLPWIVHQLAYAGWLRTYSEGQLFAASILATLCWIMTLGCYLLITTEFRNGQYEMYSVDDWILIESPFALLLGWETFSGLQSWNVSVVQLRSLSAFATPALELAAFMISNAIMVQASVLFAGLPMVMNPWLHVGLGWGTFCVALRWLAETLQRTELSDACGIASLFTFATCFFYFVVSVAILCQSKFCLPEEAIYCTEGPVGGSCYRTSPKTAKSSLSNEPNHVL